MTPKRALRALSVLIFLAALGCGDDRPETYGDQCKSNSDCESGFRCLGPPDETGYWPICTKPCTSASECPTWTATGHCEGPITPVCSQGFCDYLRCE